MIKILFTSSLISSDYELRKTQYINSYNNLLKYASPDQINILECFSDSIDFFMNLKSKTYISKNKKNNLKNKGAKECICLKEFFENTNSDENDLYIKITGRYSLDSDWFFEQINNNLEFDFYGKLMDNNQQIFTGLFAIKSKLFKDFLNWLDIDKMEINMINFEKLLKNYIDSSNSKSLYLEKLDLTAPIYGHGIIDEKKL